MYEQCISSRSSAQIGVAKKIRNQVQPVKALTNNTASFPDYLSSITQGVAMLLLVPGIR
jgi:hypothetical protein